MCEICPKLTKRHQNDVNDVVLVSLFLTLSRFHILLWCLIADFEQANTTWDTVIAIIAVFFLFSNESKVQGPVNSSSTCGDSLQVISNFPRSSCILIFLLGIAMCFHQWEKSFHYCKRREVSASGKMVARLGRLWLTDVYN